MNMNLNSVSRRKKIAFRGVLVARWNLFFTNIQELVVVALFIPIFHTVGEGCMPEAYRRSLPGDARKW